MIIDLADGGIIQERRDFAPGSLRLLLVVAGIVFTEAVVAHPHGLRRVAQLGEEQRVRRAIFAKDVSANCQSMRKY